MFKAVIYNIDEERYVASEGMGVLVHTDMLNEALCFFDEDDAESVLEGLNSNYPDCFTLITL